MDALSFEFEENPTWRKTEETTSTMLEEISKMAEDYEKLPEKAKEFSRTLFARSMAIEYVHHSNIGESVGTQASDDTKKVLERLLLIRKSELEGKGGESAKQWSTKESVETINTCKALDEMHELHGKMDKTGLITMQQLRDVHRSLLEGLHKKNGRLRIGDEVEEDVHTNTEDGPHHYPSPKLVEQLIYSTIDHHNVHMEYFRENQEKMTKLQKVNFLFKSAAWLLFHFVDIHPFCNGNGRMCRLLGNYVLSLVTPFPVSVYHIHQNRSHRGDYINAIVRCRKNPDEGPRELAAMMVEGAWLGWRSLFKNLESPHMQHLKGGVDRLGPIVVKKSQLKDEELVEKVERVCQTTSTLEVAKAIEAVKKVINETDVSLLEPFKHYLVKDVPIHGTEVVIVLNIYH